MSRKPLTQWEREQKEVFEKQLKSYSLTALQNIMNIADKALDQRVRLQANQYLLDKCVGKSYVLFDETEHKDKNLLNINLITVGSNKKDFKETDVWEDSEEWETDIYIPNPSRIH